MSTFGSSVAVGSSSIQKLRLGRVWSALAPWIRAFWAPVLAVAAGVGPARETVVASIESTPHPILVYSIFAGFGVGASLLAWGLWRYESENALLQKLKAADDQGKRNLLVGMEKRSDLAPVYRRAFAHGLASSADGEASVDRELEAAMEILASKLALVGYISGALVGLGLVGTFIGLLGTLEDLSKVFGGLQAVGSSDANPVALFGDMVKRLQEPMRGMGTAFVASLYGLLGSLVLGLSLQSVKGRLTELAPSFRKFVLSQEEAEDDSYDAVDGFGAPAVAALEQVAARVHEHVELGARQSDLLETIAGRLATAEGVGAQIGSQIGSALTAVMAQLERSVMAAERGNVLRGELLEQMKLHNHYMRSLDARADALVRLVEETRVLLLQGLRIGLTSVGRIGPAFMATLEQLQQSLAEWAAQSGNRHDALLQKITDGNDQRINSVAEMNRLASEVAAKLDALLRNGSALVELAGHQGQVTNGQFKQLMDGLAEPLALLQHIEAEIAKLSAAAENQKALVAQGRELNITAGRIETRMTTALGGLGQAATSLARLETQGEKIREAAEIQKKVLVDGLAGLKVSLAAVDQGTQDLAADVQHHFETVERKMDDERSGVLAAFLARRPIERKPTKWIWELVAFVVVGAAMLAATWWFVH